MNEIPIDVIIPSWCDGKRMPDSRMRSIGLLGGITVWESAPSPDSAAGEIDGPPFPGEEMLTQAVTETLAKEYNADVEANGIVTGHEGRFMISGMWSGVYGAGTGRKVCKRHRN